MYDDLRVRYNLLLLSDVMFDSKYDVKKCGLTLKF